jgi:hypothetical protein
MSARKVVSVVVFRHDGVLVARNPKWKNKFALPAKQVDPTADPMDEAALAAVREDLGLPLPRATGWSLGYLHTTGVSGRTGEEVEYDYWAYEVEPGEPLAELPAHARFVTRDELLAAEAEAKAGKDVDYTWSTLEVFSSVRESQEVAVAVITRPGRATTEYLTLMSDRYNGLFFPAGRMINESDVRAAARRVVRAELNYNGPREATPLARVPDVPIGSRPEWGKRTYNFHIAAVELPPWHEEVTDLHRPGGPMEAHLREAERRRGRAGAGRPPGWSWRWLTAEQLLAPPAGVDLSPTMKAVAPTVLKVVPPVNHPLRTSEGAVALIRGKDRHGQDAVLAQWNERWGAFFLIGGHRDGTETFRQCVAREVVEELELARGEPHEFEVEPPYPPLEYVAWSRGYDQYTAYTMHRFEVKLTPAGLASVEANWDRLRLYWLTRSEISNLQTTDGRRVSETVQIVV